MMSKTLVCLIAWPFFVRCFLYNKPKVQNLHSPNHTKHYKKITVLIYRLNIRLYMSPNMFVTGMHWLLVTFKGPSSFPRTTVKVNCKFLRQFQLARLQMWRWRKNSFVCRKCKSTLETCSNNNINICAWRKVCSTGTQAFWVHSTRTCHHYAPLVPNLKMQRSAAGHTALSNTRAKYNLCSKHMTISEVRKIVKVISDYYYRYRWRNLSGEVTYKH